MRPIVLVSCFVIACAHAPRAAVTLATPRSQGVVPVVRGSPSKNDDLTNTVDARAWAALADWLCKDVGAVEYGDAIEEIESTKSLGRLTTDVSFGVPREGFFDPKAAVLLAGAIPWLERVAQTFVKLPKGATLVMTSSLEDDAAALPAPVKNAIATQRAVAIRGALVAAGVDPSRLVTRSVTQAWEGSYDGPATLDPSEGRITFAVTR